MPIREILGFVLVAVGIGVVARAGYLILGGGRHSGQDRAMLEQMQARLTEAEEHGRYPSW